ncbi:MAG: DUF1571 domain-containing protein, partial [Gemmatales bacterium]|nr:DUF1571 domain-containing protein [Gemmatales bacterium]
MKERELIVPWRALGRTLIVARPSSEGNNPKVAAIGKRWPEERSEPGRRSPRQSWPGGTSRNKWLMGFTIVFMASMGCHWMAWLDPQRWPRDGSLPGADHGGVSQDERLNLSENGMHVPQGRTASTGQSAAASSRGMGTEYQPAAQAEVSKCEASESALPQAARTEASRWIRSNNVATAVLSHIVGEPKRAGDSEPPRGTIPSPPSPFNEHTVVRGLAHREGAAETGEWAKVEQLIVAAQQRYAQVQDYVCRFRRREVLADGTVSQDMMLLRVRKEPWSVHFVWPKGSADEGREVLYVQGRFHNQLVV